MPDREKVIKGLEICVGGDDFSVCMRNECPYIGGSQDGYCITNLERDALALLKEQEEIELCDRCGRRRLKSNREGR